MKRTILFILLVCLLEWVPGIAQADSINARAFNKIKKASRLVQNIPLEKVESVKPFSRLDKIRQAAKNLGALRSVKPARTLARAKHADKIYSNIAELDVKYKDFPYSNDGVVLKASMPKSTKREMAYDYLPQSLKPIVLDKPETKKLAKPCSFNVPMTQSQGNFNASQIQFNSPLAKNINKLSNSYWAGQVTAAMTAMRILQGPLSKQEEKAFNASWAPYFDYPTDKAKAWLNKLTPLVTEFLACQQKIESLLTFMEDLKYEVQMAAAYDKEEDCQDILAQMGEVSQELKKQKQFFSALAKDLAQVGDPPNPLAEKCAARKRAKRLIRLEPLSPKEKTIKPKEKMPDSPLPDFFFKKLPPSMAGFFRDKGMWYWLKQKAANKDMPMINVDNELPFKVRDDFSWHSEKFYGHDLKWKGLSFSSSMEDPGFSSVRCKKGKDERKQWARYQMVGRISKDGYKIEKLICKITVRWCASIDTWGPDGKENTADDSYKLVKKVETREIAFKNLPLYDVSPILIGSQKGVILKYGVKGINPTRASLVDMTKDWPKAKPLPSNFIELNFRLSQGGLKKPIKKQPPILVDKKQRKIAFHQNNIKWLKKDIAWLNKQLANAKDRKSLSALYFQLTCKKSDLQGEKDAIQRIKTGQWVRTPTAFDSMVKVQMLNNSRQMAASIKKVETNRKRIDRMLKALPPGERGNMKKWARKQLSQKPLDQETQKKVGRIVAQRLQAVNQGISAKAAGDEAIAQLGVDIMENYQSAAQVAMYATPFVAGGGVLAITYGITSGGIVGYQQDGIKGAVKGAGTTALRYWSPKIDYALTFYEGYQQGGLTSAIKHTAIVYVKRKAVQTVTQGIQRYQHRRNVAAKKARLNDWKDAQRRVRFKQEREYGKKMVKRLNEYQKKYDQAKASGAGRKSLRLLEKKIMDQTAAIKNAPHAKGYLKFNATTKEQTAYGVWDKRHTNKIVRELKQDLARQGFDPNELRFNPIRNAGNTTPGMDLDLAMNSTRGQIIRYRDPKTGQTRNLDLYTANAMVQDRFNVVYARNSGGRKASNAWQNVTTSRHLEAYPDTNWLRIRSMQRQGIDPRCHLDPNYAEDAGRVTSFKAHEMRKHGSSFKDNQNWEIYRGTSKDIKSKVIPLLQNRIDRARNSNIKVKLQKKMQFYNKLSNAMDKANHDPVASDREIKKLTTLDTLDTVDMVSSAIEALGKW